MPRKSKYAIPDEKKELLMNLIETYNVKTTADLQKALKDLLGGTIQTMLEQEIETQIDEREAADPAYGDSRNGYKPKTLRSTLGEIPIQGSEMVLPHADACVLFLRLHDPEPHRDIPAQRTGHLL